MQWQEMNHLQLPVHAAAAATCDEMRMQMLVGLSSLALASPDQTRSDQLLSGKLAAPHHRSPTSVQQSGKITPSSICNYNWFGLLHHSQHRILFVDFFCSGITKKSTYHSCSKRNLIYHLHNRYLQTAKIVNNNE